MKKTITLSLVTLITLAVVVANALSVRPAAAAVQPAKAAQAIDPRRAAYVNSLPADVVVPDVLPAGIQDAMLMEAWIRLYNSTEPVQMWDGSTLTGRALALYALVSEIPVVWDTDNICNGGSCSQHFCVKGQDICDFEDGNPGIDPIYVKPMAQAFGAGMTDLVSTLAHEIFHRTEPFGGVRDTRYEEYNAYYVGEKTSGATVIVFGTYNPLNSADLTAWIKENRLDGYFPFPEYPAAVASLVVASVE